MRERVRRVEHHQHARHTKQSAYVTRVGYVHCVPDIGVLKMFSLINMINERAILMLDLVDVLSLTNIWRGKTLVRLNCMTICVNHVKCVRQLKCYDTYSHASFVKPHICVTGASCGRHVRYLNCVTYVRRAEADKCVHCGKPGMR